jgi:hypothetical protein
LDVQVERIGVFWRRLGGAVIKGFKPAEPGEEKGMTRGRGRTKRWVMDGYESGEVEWKRRGWGSEAEGAKGQYGQQKGESR